MVKRASPSVTDISPPEEAPEYERLHSASLVCDLHCDTLTKVLKGYSLKERHEENHIDLPRLKAGGVDVQMFACFVDPSHKSQGYANYAQRMIHAMYDQIQKNPEDISQNIQIISQNEEKK